MTVPELKGVVDLGKVVVEVGYADGTAIFGDPVDLVVGVVGGKSDGAAVVGLLLGSMTIGTDMGGARDGKTEGTPETIE